MKPVQRTPTLVAALMVVFATACGENAVDPSKSQDDAAESTDSAAVDVHQAADTETDTSVAEDTSATPDVHEAVDGAADGNANADATSTADAPLVVDAEEDAGPVDTWDPLALTDGAAAGEGTCEAWCSAIAKGCGAKGIMGGPYEALADAKSGACLAWCKDVAKWTPGVKGHSVGDTLACRIHHAEEAQKGPVAAANHCVAAGPTGGGVCGTPCEAYCHVATTACSGTYKSVADCELECAGVRGEYEGKVPCLFEQLAAEAIDGKKSPTSQACTASSIKNGKTTSCELVLPKTAATVKTQGASFLPKEVTISVGESVLFVLPQGHNAVEVSDNEWQNNGNKALPGGFVVAFGETKVVTFKKAGVSYYVCQVHAGGGMKGRVTVK